MSKAVNKRKRRQRIWVRSYM